MATFPVIPFFLESNPVDSPDAPLVRHTTIQDSVTATRLPPSKPPYWHPTVKKAIPSDNGISLFGSAALVGAGAADDDGNFENQGVAYYFRDLSNASGEVNEDVILAPFTGNAQDFFGSSVSLWQDTALIGNRDRLEPEKAYFFRNLDQASGTKTEDLILTFSEGAGSEITFGQNVTHQESSALIWAISGNNGTGSVYLYRDLNSAEDVITENAVLIPSDGVSADFFGFSVSLDGDFALVGAPSHDNSAGKAYLYRELATADGLTPETAWLDFVKQDGANTRFGSSVSISGPNAIVGAPSSTNSSREPLPGSVFLYTDLDTATGRQLDALEITPNNSEDLDQFGYLVKLEDDLFSIIGRQDFDVFQGQLSSFTTLDEGNTDRVIDEPFIYKSRTDLDYWSEFTSGNTMTLGEKIHRCHHRYDNKLRKLFR